MWSSSKAITLTVGIAIGSVGALTSQHFLAPGGEVKARANLLEARAAEAQPQPCGDEEAQLRVRLLKAQAEKWEADARLAQAQAEIAAQQARQLEIDNGAKSFVPQATVDLLCDIKKRQGKPC